MPCHVDPPTEGERSSARKASTARASFHMHMADMLREALLARPQNRSEVERLVTLGDLGSKRLPHVNPYGDSKALRDQRLEHAAEYDRAYEAAQAVLAGKRFKRKQIEADQIRHREEDVKRLIKTFTDQGKYGMILPLLSVDFEKPLEPQLGYDPDSY